MRLEVEAGSTHGRLFPEKDENNGSDGSNGELQKLPGQADAENFAIFAFDVGQRRGVGDLRGLERVGRTHGDDGDDSHQQDQRDAYQRRDAHLHLGQEKISREALAEGHASQKGHARIERRINQLAAAGEHSGEKGDLPGVYHEIDGGAADQKSGERGAAAAGGDEQILGHVGALAAETVRDQGSHQNEKSGGGEDIDGEAPVSPSGYSELDVRQGVFDRGELGEKNDQYAQEQRGVGSKAHARGKGRAQSLRTGRADDALNALPHGKTSIKVDCAQRNGGARHQGHQVVSRPNLREQDNRDGVAQSHGPEKYLRFPFEETEAQDLDKAEQRKKDQRDAEQAGAADDFHDGNTAGGIRNRRGNKQTVEGQCPGKIHKVAGAGGESVEAKIDEAGNRYRISGKAVERGDETAHDGDQSDGTPLLVPTGNDGLHRFQQNFQQSGIAIGLPEDLAGVEDQEARPHGEIAPERSLDTAQRGHMVIAEGDHQFDQPRGGDRADGIPFKNEEGGEEHRKGRERDRDF